MGALPSVGPHQVGVIVRRERSDVPGYTAGWENTELGPWPRLAEPPRTEAWVELWLVVDGAEVLPLAMSTQAEDVARADAEAAAATVQSCRDGDRLAVVGLPYDDPPGDWVFVEPGRVGPVPRSAGLSCAYALKEAPSHWIALP